jgi:hypothetical protein
MTNTNVCPYFRSELSADLLPQQVMDDQTIFELRQKVTHAKFKTMIDFVFQTVPLPKMKERLPKPKTNIVR